MEQLAQRHSGDTLRAHSGHCQKHLQLEGQEPGWERMRLAELARPDHKVVSSSRTGEPVRDGG